MRWAQEKTENIFGKVKRYCHRFTHLGMAYELLRGRHLLIHQDKFVDGLNKVDTTKARQTKPKEAPTSAEVHQLRRVIDERTSITTQFHFNSACEMLEWSTAQLNVIIGRAIRNIRLAGLHFPELEPPFRWAGVAGASHGNI
eukprot:5317602-Pyramimonas_sp.AAC.1